MKDVPADNPHIWIPVIVVDMGASNPEQQRAEECRLCGTFRNGATPDPPDAALPCPFPPPTLPELTGEEQRDNALLNAECVVQPTLPALGISAASFVQSAAAATELSGHENTATR